MTITSNPYKTDARGFSFGFSSVGAGTDGVGAGTEGAGCTIIFGLKARGKGTLMGAAMSSVLVKNRYPMVWIRGNRIETQAQSLQRPVTRQSEL